jgi:hypothetical protein
MPQALEDVFKQLPAAGGDGSGGGLRVVVSAYEVRCAAAVHPRLAGCGLHKPLGSWP